MVVAIGQTFGSVGASGALRTGSRGGDVLAPVGADMDDSGDGVARALFDRNPRPAFRVGFGDGTVSVPGAAVNALDRGLYAGRRAVWTARQVHQQNQERQGKKIEPTRRPPYRQLERRPIDVALNSRSFIARLNDVAGTTEARLRGDEPPPAENGAVIEVNDETFRFRSPPNGARLDLLA